MPAYGIIPDSPWIYAAGKAFKYASKEFKTHGLKLKPRNLQITMTFGKLVIYKPILNFELNHDFGTVGRHLHKTANRIQQLARLQVGKKTGNLMRSIKLKHVPRNALGPGVSVGGYTSYALMHHQGTKPHIITPNKPGGQLVFMKGSRVIHTPVVRHPGTKPNHYLTRPMEMVVRSQIRTLR